MLRLSQFLLLQTASDDSLIRLKRTDVADQQEMLMNLYYSVQQHSSVIDFVQHHIHSDTNSTKGLLLQVKLYYQMLSYKILIFHFHNASLFCVILN